MEFNNKCKVTGEEKPGHKIYLITNKDGEVYIGTTRYTVISRYSSHITLLKRLLKENKRLNYLQESFVKHGTDGHTVEVYKNLGQISHLECLEIETNTINEFKLKGYRLLNMAKA